MRFYWIVGTRGWSLGKGGFRREGPSEWRIVIGRYKDGSV